VQVEPVKTVLKAPGTKRLKLQHGDVLSSFAFNSNLRRYIEGRRLHQAVSSVQQRWVEVGAYTRPLFSST